MDPLTLRIFQRQVADQSRMVAFASSMIEAAVEARDHDSLWVGVQIFVTGSANITKALWGQRQSLAAERKPLRDSLGVRDDSPLHALSTLRNHFEHYDERIDRWHETSQAHNFLDRFLGSPESVAGLADIERFRDPATASVYFWGERFDLQPIAKEVDRLLTIAKAEADKPH